MPELRKENPLVYTVAEAAELLGIGINAMYRLVHMEGFPSRQVSPRRWVISKPGLEKWLAEGGSL